MRRRRRSCSTSSTSCAISARRSTRCARPNTPALSGKDRRFIKGQKYTLLSRHENLTLEGRRSLELLLAANKRLNTAYLLKEIFGQLWDYDARGLGAALLRQLARQPQVAAARALRNASPT